MDDICSFEDLDFLDMINSLISEEIKDEYSPAKLARMRVMEKLKNRKKFGKIRIYACKRRSIAKRYAPRIKGRFVSYDRKDFITIEESLIRNGRKIKYEKFESI